MKQYETAFLVSPSLGEEDNEKLISQMAEVISEKKGRMIKEDRWGKRKLAYQIKRFQEAFYVFFHYEGGADIPLELERRFKQTEAVLRFLTVKKETRENIRRKKKGVPVREEGAAAAEQERAGEESRHREDLPADETGGEEV